MDILASRTLLHPADFDRTLTFLPRRPRPGGRPRVRQRRPPGRRLFAGGGFLEVVGTGPGPGRPGIELWLQVRSMDATVAELDARGLALAVRRCSSPGASSSLVDDPDGVRIHLVEVPVRPPLRRDVRPDPM